MTVNIPTAPLTEGVVIMTIKQSARVFACFIFFSLLFTTLRLAAEGLPQIATKTYTAEQLGLRVSYSTPAYVTETSKGTYLRIQNFISAEDRTPTDKDILIEIASAHSGYEVVRKNWAQSKSVNIDGKKCWELKKYIGENEGDGYISKLGIYCSQPPYNLMAYIWWHGDETSPGAKDARQIIASIHLFNPVTIDSAEQYVKQAEGMATNWQSDAKLVAIRSNSNVDQTGNIGCVPTQMTTGWAFLFFSAKDNAYYSVYGCRGKTSAHKEEAAAYPVPPPAIQISDIPIASSSVMRTINRITKDNMLKKCHTIREMAVATGETLYGVNLPNGKLIWKIQLYCAEDMGGSIFTDTKSGAVLGQRISHTKGD